MGLNEDAAAAEAPKETNEGAAVAEAPMELNEDVAAADQLEQEVQVMDQDHPAARKLASHRQAGVINRMDPGAWQLVPYVI